MTRFIHDQFAKQYLIELLVRFGQVEASKDISSEVRQIDIFFIPLPQATNNLDSLGLLGRIASTPVIIEPFRNPVTSTGILTCLGKLISIQEQLARQSHQNNQPGNPSPKLWILSPTISPELLASCQATADESQWVKGIYFLPEILKTALVAIHQLPRTPETMWLRILGRAYFYFSVWAIALGIILQIMAFGIFYPQRRVEREDMIKSLVLFTLSSTNHHASHCSH